jgi:hypothetical protein
MLQFQSYLLQEMSNELYDENFEYNNNVGKTVKHASD